MFEELSGTGHHSGGISALPIICGLLLDQFEASLQSHLCQEPAGPWMVRVLTPAPNLASVFGLLICLPLETAAIAALLRP